MLERLGEFLFRWRSLVFPLLIAGIAVGFPPRPIDTLLGLMILIIGVLVAYAGQMLRLLTIGFQYIERGGNQGRVFASRLVTGGMYAHCRNPMYVGNILLVAGFLLAFGRPIAAIIGLALCIVVYVAIVAAEERFLHDKFGDEFAIYAAEVPRWALDFPGVLTTIRTQSADVKTILVREYSTLSVTTFLAIGVAAWRLYERDWGAIPFAALSAVAGIVLGFYLTIRYLKKKRIVYVPR